VLLPEDVALASLDHAVVQGQLRHGTLDQPARFGRRRLGSRLDTTIVPGQYREARDFHRGDGFGAAFERKQFAKSSIGRFIFDFGKRPRSEMILKRAQAIREPRPGAVFSTTNALRMGALEKRTDGSRTPSHLRVAHRHTPATARLFTHRMANGSGFICVVRRIRAAPRRQARPCQFWPLCQTRSGVILLATSPSGGP
jgi:hypothetical protein